ncbi:MAG: hypothetical protein ACT4P6_19110 [Gemmatimonadaceae bacterium]
MPATTAQALAVASRNVLGVLSDQEKANVDAQDIESVIRRFNNKRVRATPSARKKDKVLTADFSEAPNVAAEATTTARPGTYQSALPVRPGVVVTIANVPYDLTPAEAERLANFVRMLAVKPNDVGRIVTRLTRQAPVTLNDSSAAQESVLFLSRVATATRFR